MDGTYSARVVLRAARAEENQFRARARKPFAAPREDGTGRTAWIPRVAAARACPTVRSVNGMSRAIRCARARALLQRLRRRAVAISLVRPRRFPLPERVLPLAVAHPGPPAQRPSKTE